MLETFKDIKEDSAEGILKSILVSAFYGIMSFRSVRNEKGEIIDFEWLFLNDVAEKIIGRKSGELKGRKLLKEMPEAEKLGLFEKFKKVVETGETLTFEQLYPRKKINKWFRISVVKLGDGFTETFQDISDLKENIHQVQTRERKYQQLFEQSMDAIFMMDEDLRFLEANPAFLELFDIKNEEIIGKNVRQLFYHESDFEDFFKDLIEQKKVEEKEAIMRSIKGQKKDCLINSVLILHSDAGNNDRNCIYLGVIRDMTKKKQADRELLRAEKMAMSGKIARTIAHEVRNPLTNLTLALEQLKDEIPQDEIEDSEMYFKIIQRNAERIGNLISDLLHSSKPKALKLEPHSLNEQISEALELVKDRLKLKEMKLEENYAADIPDVKLDPDQFKIALLNLFVNAIEAMKPNKGKLMIRTSKEDDHARLIIGDNGKGIPKENINKLFEPFFTGKREGTGLGLTVVQNIIHGHGGRIEAESVPEKGTDFILHFPFAS